MATKRFPLRTKIYIAPDGGELRRTRRPDGIAFATTITQVGEDDKPPVSRTVELQMTNDNGNLLICMRRIARRPDSWFCNTSTIRLPPRAAADLVQSLSLLTKVLRPEIQVVAKKSPP